MRRRRFLGASAATALGLTAALSSSASPAAADTARTPPPAAPWYEDAKLGIFVHWTAASIPAFAPLVLPDLSAIDDPDTPVWRQRQFWRALPYAEMYQNTMAVPGSETARYHAARYPGRSYDSFVAEFSRRSVASVDLAGWAEQFERFGARYVVLTTKIEDGFLLWPSEHRNPRRQQWQSRRDVVGELADAVRSRGLRFGTYYSGGMDWSFGGIPIVDNASLIGALPRGRDYLDYANAHWHELIQRYEPSVLWNDYGFLPYEGLDALFATYEKTVPDGVVNDRFDAEAQAAGKARADFVTLEYARTDGPADRKWEACRGIGYSFGYNRLDDATSYLTPAELVHLFVDVVAHGGNLLINVGPTDTGEIVAAQAQPLFALGSWLRANGTAIYGSRPWKRANGQTTDGQQVRYTTKDGSLHAVVLG
ncbi:MAG: alpha-L-fucosidase, partial [Catenulispora sp.]|nr:alpha-L-fucosidase [Catenulispora sp.]